MKELKNLRVLALRLRLFAVSKWWPLTRTFYVILSYVIYLFIFLYELSVSFQRRSIRFSQPYVISVIDIQCHCCYFVHPAMQLYLHQCSTAGSAIVLKGFLWSSPKMAPTISLKFITLSNTEFDNFYLKNFP